MARQTVLVVDPSDETLEVLRTALARQGAEILSARRAVQGLDMARRLSPTVIVLDEDSAAAWSGQLSAEYDEQSQRSQTPLLVFGNGAAASSAADRRVCGETLSLRAAGS